MFVCFFQFRKTLSQSLSHFITTTAAYLYLFVRVIPLNTELVKTAGNNSSISGGKTTTDISCTSSSLPGGTIHFSFKKRVQHHRNLLQPGRPR